MREEKLVFWFMHRRRERECEREENILVSVVRKRKIMASLKNIYKRM